MSEITHTEVVVLTNDYKIRGCIDLRPGARLTDYITSARSYFAMTDVVIEEALTGKVVFRSKFVDINRNSVVMILPADVCEDCRHQ